MENENHAWTFWWPASGVVVGYDVHGKSLGHFSVHLVQEVHELVVGVVGQALADHLAAEYVHKKKKRRKILRL